MYITYRNMLKTTILCILKIPYKNILYHIIKCYNNSNIPDVVHCLDLQM